MKKIIKYVLIFMITFFIGNISAKAEATMCEYRLPYLGFNINTSKTVKNAEKVENVYYTVKYQKTTSSSIFSYTPYKGGSNNLFVPNKKYANYIISNNKCPDYISFHTAVTTELPSVALPTDEFMKVGYAYLILVSTSDEDSFSSNIMKNSGNGSSIPHSNYAPTNFIVPLYQYTIDGETGFSTGTQKVYIENTLSNWVKYLDTLLADVKKECGSTDVNYKTTSDQNTNENNDSGHTGGGGCNTTKKCANSQDEYKEAVYSLSLYMKAITDDEKIQKLVTTYYKTDYNKLYSIIKEANLESERQKSLEELQEIYDKKKALLDNKCSAYCLNMTGTAKTECEKSSLYQKCYSCYYTNNPCSSYSGIAETECMKSYDVKSCMGEEEYNNLQNLYDKALDDIQKEIDAKKYKLSIINTPTLTGIEFEPYKVKCEDFSILHKFWNIITIVAPILTILFGVLDYAFAVIASNDEKMSKAKKKFPKRLAAALILLIIPVLIKLLVNTFAVSNNADMENAGDTSILKCIVNGE